MEFKTWRVAGSVTAGTLTLGGEPSAAPSTGSNAFIYRNVWGIMPANSAAGTVSMSGGGGISLAHLATGVPFPCHPAYISASAGTVYLSLLCP